MTGGEIFILDRRKTWKRKVDKFITCLGKILVFVGDIMQDCSIQCRKLGIKENPLQRPREAMQDTDDVQ